MYPTDHFHTTCHEAIVILSGSALLAFGGVENPRKVELEVEQGDALLIPAGMSHKQVRELGTKVFDMLGAYEIGAEHWDMCYGREEEGDTGQRIKRVGWFKQDPFYGEGGHVIPRFMQHLARVSLPRVRPCTNSTGQA